MDEDTQYGKPDSETFEIKENKCDHFFKRKDAATVDCSKCRSGWIDGGTFIVEGGKILGLAQ